MKLNFININKNLSVVLDKKKVESEEKKKEKLWIQMQIVEKLVDEE